MREIKFRAWSMGEMCYQEGVVISRLTISHTNPGGNGYEEAYSFEYDPTAVIMQYTGLKDKHGKEIYEGDILEGDVRYYGLDNLGKHSEKQLFVVERDIMKSGFFLTRIHLYPRNQRSNIKGDFINGPTKKIMGNIYENSELLK